MLTISAFAKLSRVTPNTLRYYDEMGLLKPAEVNTDNGYRYYQPAQLQTILLINKLKAYHLSLEEIAQILPHPADNDALLPLLRQKRDEIDLTVDQLTNTLNQMEQEISNLERGIHIMSYLDKIEVSIAETKPQNILYVRDQMRTADFGRYLSQLNTAIKEKNLTIIGPPMNIFHIDANFNPECYDNEIAIPVKEAGKGTRRLSGGLCAKITLKGPYTSYSEFGRSN